MEVVAIIACVAAVISAYRDGHVIVQRIKDKRRARKALPPTTLLEESLEKGSREVEEAKDNGVKRFGTEFAIGDLVATNALKDIIIELQGSLLKHLRQASEDDGMIDFSVLVDASDIGRIKAVSVLNDLYLRTAKSATTPRSVTQALPPVPISLSHVNGQARDNGRLLHPHPIPRNGNPAEIGVPSNGLERTIPPTHPTQPPPSYRPIESHDTFTGSTKRKFSGMFSRKPTFTPGDIHGGKSGSPNGVVDYSIPAHKSGSNSNRSSAMTISSQEPLDEGNPWASEFSRSPNETRNKSPRIQQSSETGTSILTQRQSSNTSKVKSEDIYGGFCKGAFKLQVGLKDGLKRRNQSGSFQGEGYYWICGSSKCAFEGRACKDNKDWGFDDTVRSSCGVRYRWAFLAKSHVALSKVKHGIYDYRCMFCVLQGYKSPVFRKDKVLMEHVSQHRDQQFDEAFLRKLRCINMREATDEEDFDVNLVPDVIKADDGQTMDTTTPDDVTTAWLMNEDTMPDTNHWGD